MFNPPLDFLKPPRNLKTIIFCIIIKPLQRNVALKFKIWMTIVTVSLNFFSSTFGYFSTEKKMKTQSLIIHDICTTGESSYFIRGTKLTCTQPPFTEWEHKLQQHLSQVMVHMVAIRSIKQKRNFQHLLKHKKPLIVQKSHSHSLQWSEESAAFWTLQPANSSFYCHGLSCHSSRRKSWNVSLWKSQENIMDWEKANLCRTK